MAQISWNLSHGWWKTPEKPQPGNGPDRVVVVVDLGFTTLLTPQVISVTFYSERENSYKFCSEALILDWGSFTSHKSMTRDPRPYFPSEGSHTQDFYARKNPSTPAGFEPKNLGFSGEYDNHGTTWVDGPSGNWTRALCVRGNDVTPRPLKQIGGLGALVQRVRQNQYTLD